MFRFSPGSRGLLEPRGGIINPRDLVRAQLAAARARGATLVADDVVSLRRKPGEVELETRGGLTLRADRVLVAAGGFTNAARLLERKLALHLSGVTVVLVETPSEPLPEIPSVTFVLRSEVGPRVGFAMPPLRYPDGRFYLKCATGSSVETVLTQESLGDWYRGPGVPGDGVPARSSRRAAFVIRLPRRGRDRHAASVHAGLELDLARLAAQPHDVVRDERRTPGAGGGKLGAHEIGAGR